MTNSTHPRRPNLRRFAGTAMACAAVTLGGVSALPSGVAEAAGIHDSRVRYLATPAGEGPTTETTRTVGAASPRPPMRIRLDADGDVIA